MSSMRLGLIDLEYNVQGQGEPLILIMGFAGDARSWGRPFVESLSRDFQVVTFSNRGCGLSTDTGGAVTCRLMADDTVLLIERLGLDRAHVFGISMGGSIAQELAIDYPERVRRVVLASTSCGVQGAPPPQDVVQVMSQVASADGLGAARTFLRLCVSETFASTEAEFLEEIARTVRPMPDLAARQLAAVRSFDSYDRLPRLLADTLILHGSEDRITLPGNSETLVGRIPNAQLMRLEGAGHMFVWERPDEAARVIGDFLNSGLRRHLQLIKGSRMAG
jgi:3-oxoadipate enol-lactonase